MTASGGRGPHPVVSVAAGLAAIAALWPSGLPRPTVVSAALTAGCVAVVTVCALLATRRSPARPAPMVATAAASLGATSCAALLSMSWQNGLRGALDMPAVGLGWAAASVAAGLLSFVLIVWLPRTTALSLAMVAALAAGMLPAATADEPAHRRPDVPADVFYADTDGASVTQRSDNLVARWVRAGGLDRRAVVIAVPTGSGWVDEAAVHSYRERFAGDVAVLAMQYSARPSWQTFVADRAAAGRTTITLLQAVLDRTGTRPPPRRPQIHIYGQSLGAVGAEAARSWADRTHPGDLAETVLVGVPGDSIARRPGMGTPRIVVANHTDPIPRWSLSLLWRPSRPPSDTRSVGRDAPRPPWLPVIGFLQASADLLGSLDGAPGVGHRYGVEQGTGSLSS